MVNFFFQPSTVLKSPLLNADKTSSLSASGKDIQVLSYDRELLTPDDEGIVLNILTNPTTSQSTLQPFTIGSNMEEVFVDLNYISNPFSKLHPSSKTFAEQTFLNDSALTK